MSKPFPTSNPVLCAALSLGVLSGPAFAEVPHVVADIPPVQSLVARVMQGVGEPDLIVPPGASVHGYSLKPSEARALQRADLVIWMGEGLAPWMEEAIESLAPKAQSIALLELPETTTYPLREGVGFEAHHHDHEGEEHAAHDEDHDDDHDADQDADHNDDHEKDHADHEDHDHDAEHAEGHKDEAHDEHDHDAHAHDEDHDHKDEHEDEHAHEDEHEHEDEHHHEGPDPHAWLDPANAQAWLGLIADALSAQDPEHAEAYAANAKAGQAELAALIDETQAALAGVQDRPFIVFHDAYQYFESRFGLQAAGAISLSDAQAPSAGRVAGIRDVVADKSVVCVFSEPQFNPAIVDTVLEGTGAKSAALDPLGFDLTPGADLYPGVIRNLAAKVVGCLGS